MNVWKDAEKQLLKKWDEREKCNQEVVSFLSDMFNIDEIDHNSFYHVPNSCGGTDGYINLPDGRQACLVECVTDSSYSAELYLLSGLKK